MSGIDWDWMPVEELLRAVDRSDPQVRALAHALERHGIAELWEEYNQSTGVAFFGLKTFNGMSITIRCTDDYRERFDLIDFLQKMASACTIRFRRTLKMGSQIRESNNAD